MSDPTKAAVTLSSAHGIGTVRVAPVNTCKLGTVRPCRSRRSRVM